MKSYFIPFALFVCVAALTLLTSAQTFVSSGSGNFGVGGSNNKSVRPLRRKTKTAAAQPAPATTSENILSGAVDVIVHSISDRTIRLGLAPGGITIVEFPASDFIYARHPGDENFVTIDESLKARSNPSDPLIFRPGKGFFIPSAKTKQIPYGQITVQMTSGAVFTFQIYPVKNLNQSASRLQVLYSPEEIISERKRRGLPVNLNIPRSLPAAETMTGDASDSEDKKEAEKQAEKQVAADSSATPRAEKTEPAETPSTPQSRIEELSKKSISEAAGYKWNFGAPVHGLAIAAQPTLIMEDGTYRLDFIAVKNTLSEPISLVNLPNLLIETYDAKSGKKSALNQEVLPAEFIFHDLPASLIIQPGGQVYFAIVAKYPVILGANQELRLGVAQTNAADEPVFLNLVTRAR